MDPVPRRCVLAGGWLRLVKNRLSARRRPGARSEVRCRVPAPLPWSSARLRRGSAAAARRPGAGRGRSRCIWPWRRPRAARRRACRSGSSPGCRPTGAIPTAAAWPSRPRSGPRAARGCSTTARPGGAPLLAVPSLINRAYVLDLAPGRSLLRYLAAQGLRPLLVDWGAPGDARAAPDARRAMSRGGWRRRWRSRGGPAGRRRCCSATAWAVCSRPRSPLQRPADDRGPRSCWRRPGISTPSGPPGAPCGRCWPPRREALAGCSAGCRSSDAGLFAGLDPLAVARKFARFAELDPDLAGGARASSRSRTGSTTACRSAPRSRGNAWSAGTARTGRRRAAGGSAGGRWRRSGSRCLALVAIPTQRPHRAAGLGRGAGARGCPRRRCCSPTAAISAWWSAARAPAAAVDPARQLAAADCCDAKLSLVTTQAIAYIAVNCRRCAGPLGAQPRVARPGRDDPQPGSSVGRCND